MNLSSFPPPTLSKPTWSHEYLPSLIIFFSFRPIFQLKNYVQKESINFGGINNAFGA